jgi:hypothetical protein
VRVRTAAVLAALTLSTLGACGCSGSSHPKSQPPPPKRCPLTGRLPAAGQDPGRVAVAVKIDNVDVARPQVGLDHADLVIEETVEGGLTRLFTVFQCDRVTTVGPVRSARTSDAALLRLLDGAVLGYSGANPKAIKPVAQLSHAVLLSYDANPALFHRDSARPAPHNLFTSTETLARAGLHKDGSLDAPPALFSYGAVPAGASPATSVSLRWSPDASAGWTWSSSRWLRTQNGSPDVLADHKRVSADNVVLMRITTKDTGLRDVAGNASPEDVVTGSGKVWVLRDGKVVTGSWKRAGLGSPLTFVDGAGTTIPLTPGRTWIELLPPNATVQLR